ncbi:MAG: VCBS repeat-containing protein [Pirellulales bacterium]|nr:VCBS repeat-containing protein [Pirellulales bacterium]
MSISVQTNIPPAAPRNRAFWLERCQAICVGPLALLLCGAAIMLTACGPPPDGDAPGSGGGEPPVVYSGAQPADPSSESSHQLAGAPTKALEACEASEVSQAVFHVPSKLIDERHRKGRDLIDPKKDGWDSEVISQRVQKQLDEIATAVASGAGAEQLQAFEWVDPEFTAGDLYAAGGQVVFQAPQLEVRHPTVVAGGEARGKTRFSQVFGAIVEWFPSGATTRTHVKTIEIKSDGAAGDGQTGETRTTATQHIVALFWSHAGRRGSYHATWNCRWKEIPQQGMYLLTLEAADVEEVQYIDSPGGSGGWFQDDSAAVFGSCSSYQSQLVPGLNHWLRRVDTVDGMYLFAEFGIAVGDVNGDHRDDLYVCQPAGLPNRLFLQMEDGTVRDVSAESRTDWKDQTSSALLIDLDNDGDQDLVLATSSRYMLVMENDGSGHFEVRNKLPFADRNVKGLSAADYDSDGDLDIYLTIAFADHRARPDEERPEFIYYNANDGGANVLFQNDITPADWKFTDVTVESGLDVNNRRHSLAAAWEDFDDDGDQDLYVANDYGQNCLYRNDGGRFTEIAELSGTVDYGGGMSVDWLDYDRDGRMDLMVANMFSSAGRRITTQLNFLKETGAEIGALLNRFAKGNTLYKNLGDGRFLEVSGDAHVEHARWAWSTVSGDWNNDGWDDLYVANGYVTNTDTKDL